jgi:hypothetical protein
VKSGVQPLRQKRALTNLFPVLAPSEVAYSASVARSLSFLTRLGVADDWLAWSSSHGADSKASDTISCWPESEGRLMLSRGRGGGIQGPNWFQALGELISLSLECGDNGIRD